MGALAHYVSHADPAYYNPTNITHGIMEPLPNPPRDKMKKKMQIAERALADLAQWMGSPQSPCGGRPSGLPDHLVEADL
jgi:methylenetetrahydrofolate--tRNA-(uracil-5-)-methyltransferase